MPRPSHPLTGKVALVTGGSRGIGAAIVRRLAEDGADGAFSYSASPDRARLVVHDVEALGRRAVAIKADQASPAEVEALVREAHAELGGLDILVNSAGVFVTGMVDGPWARQPPKQSISPRWRLPRAGSCRKRETALTDPTNGNRYA